MVRIGKYTSRRTALKKGGSIIPPSLTTVASGIKEMVGGGPEVLKEVAPDVGEYADPMHTEIHRNANQLIKEASKAVYHPHQHDPQDIIDVAQKHIGSAPHFAQSLLGSMVHEIPKHYNFAPLPLTTRFSDKRANYMGHAMKVRHTFGTDDHAKTHHHRVAGALDFKQVFSDTKTLAEGFNPADSAGKAMDSFNKINLHNTTARGIAKNALHGYAGNLRAHAAYAQTYALMMTPAVALGAAVPMAGFAATGQALRGYADGVDAVNRRI